MKENDQHRPFRRVFQKHGPASLVVERSPTDWLDEELARAERFSLSGLLQEVKGAAALANCYLLRGVDVPKATEQVLREAVYELACELAIEVY